MKFGVIDLIIVIFLCLGAVLGFIKGFKKSHLTSFASSCGFLVCYLLGGPIARAIANTDVVSYNLEEAYSSILPSTDTFTALVSTDLETRQSQFAAGLTEMNFPTIFQGIFITRVTDISGDVSHALASSFAYLTVIAITYLVLYLLTFFLVKGLLSPLWNEGSLFGENGKTIPGRICGLIRGVASSAYTLLVLFLVLILINNLMVKAGNTSLNDWLVDDLPLEDPSLFSLGRLFYNTAQSFWGWIPLLG